MKSEKLQQKFDLQQNSKYSEPKFYSNPKKNNMTAVRIVVTFRISGGTSGG